MPACAWSVAIWSASGGSFVSLRRAAEWAPMQYAQLFATETATAIISRSAFVRVE